MHRINLFDEPQKQISSPQNEFASTPKSKIESDNFMLGEM